MSSLSKWRHATPVSIEHVSNPFLTLHREVERAMDDFYHLFERGDTQVSNFEGLHLLPAMDLIEKDKEFELHIEMAGLNEKDIKLSINQNMLTITGEKTLSTKTENKKFVSREISYGSYERHIALPLTAEPEKATASFKKGILCVTIPKKADSKGQVREIPITNA